MDRVVLGDAARGSLRGGEKNRGFSLLEMLVAITILGLVLGMIYEASTGAVRNVKVAQDYSYAMLFAQSLLNEYGQQPAPGFRASGEAEGFKWTVTAEPIAALETVPDVRLQKFESQVTWGGLRQREFVLSTVVGVADAAP
jgi:general secretion pathway protein I